MSVLVTVISRHICYLLNIEGKFCFSLPKDLKETSTLRTNIAYKASNILKIKYVLQKSVLFTRVNCFGRPKKAFMVVQISRSPPGKFRILR